VENIEV